MKLTKSQLREIIREEIQRMNEYDEWHNTRIQAKNIFRMLKQKHKNNIPKMKKGLEVIFKQNKTKSDQQKIMWQEFNKFFKIKESVNEAAPKMGGRPGEKELKSITRQLERLKRIGISGRHTAKLKTAIDNTKKSVAKIEKIIRMSSTL